MRVGELGPADVRRVPAPREELFYGEGTFFRLRGVATWAAKQFKEFPYKDADWSAAAPDVTLATLTAPTAPTSLQIDRALRSRVGSSTEPAGRDAALQDRAEWIQREKRRHGLKALAIDRKTYNKIVACNEVTEPLLDKIAEHLKVWREEIPGAPLT